VGVAEEEGHSMIPEQVLELQGEMLERLPQRSWGIYLAAYANDMQAATDPGAPRLSEKYGVQMARSIHAGIRVAEAHHVTADMSHAVQSAGARLPGIAHLDVEDLPTPAGFAVFDEPLLIQTREGNSQRVDVMVWWPGTIKEKDGRSYPGAWLTYLAWNRPVRDHALMVDLATRDRVQAEFPDRNFEGPIAKARALLSELTLAAGEMDEQVARTAADMHRVFGSLLVVHMDCYSWGSRVGVADLDPVTKLDIGSNNHVRLAVAYWALLGERVADIS
jgi:hypothetical protein